MPFIMNSLAFWQILNWFKSMCQGNWNDWITDEQSEQDLGDQTDMHYVQALA